MELFLKKLGNGQDNDKENDVGTDKYVCHLQVLHDASICDGNSHTKNLPLFCLF